MPAFPWWQRRAWLHGRDCHNLCILIIGLRRQHSQAQHLLAKLVAPFLKPPQCLVACGRNSNIFFINADSGDLLRNVDVGHSVHSLGCAPSGESLAVRCDNEHVLIIDAEYGNVLVDIQLGERPQGPIVYAPSGEYIAMVQYTSCGRGRRLYILDSRSGDVFRDVAMTAGLVNLVYAPNGQTIAALHKNGYLVLIEVERGIELHQLSLGYYGPALDSRLRNAFNLDPVEDDPVEDDPVEDDQGVGAPSMSLVYTPSSDSILVGLGWSCKVIRIVDVESGATIRDVVVHTPGPPNQAPYPSFSPNAKSIAIWKKTEGVPTGSFHIVDIASDAMTLHAVTIRNDFEHVIYTEFAPDCKSLAVVDELRGQTHLIAIKSDSGDALWRKPLPLPSSAEYGNIVLRYLYCCEDVPPAELPEGKVEGIDVPLHCAQVTQAVIHMEPPARIDKQEAAEFSAVQYADFVERNLNAMANEQADSQEKIWMCKINRNTKQLRTALCVGTSLRICREALEADGHSCIHRSGAMIFVHPPQYRPVLIELENFYVKPDNIVFSESFEYLVQETLDGCKGMCKVGRQIVDIGDTISELAAAGSEGAEPIHEDAGNCEQLDTLSQVLPFDLQIQRTFICAVPTNSSESMLTASTTDAHSACGTNPRRTLMRATLDE